MDRMGIGDWNGVASGGKKVTGGGDPGHRNPGIYRLRVGGGFSEEVRHPRRSIPTATYLAVAVIAVLYGTSAWAMTVAAGPDQIVQAAHDQGPDVVFNLAAAHLGHTAAVLGHVLFSTSIMAGAISFHDTIARHVFALGREHAPPAVFGRTSTSGARRAAGRSRRR
jgi:amino acid transporter